MPRPYPHGGLYSRAALLILLFVCCYPPARAEKTASPRNAQKAPTAQSTPADSATGQLPPGYFSRIQDKTSGIDRQLTRRTEKYLKKIARREEQIHQQLAAIDPAAAGNLFSNSAAGYASLLKKIKTDSAAPATTAAPPLKGEYQPYTDSLRTSLSFLQQNPQLLNSAGKTPQQLQARLQTATGQLQQLQTHLGDACDVETFVNQRKQQIKECLSRYTTLPGGLSKEYKGLTQDMYYYSQQVQQYKQLLNDPDKLEKKAMGLLSQTPAFQDFMKTHSQLASLFGLPGNASNINPSTSLALTGLQTRDQLQQTIQQQISAGGSGAMQAMQQNVDAAQSQLSTLKDRLEKYGAGGGNIESPDFKPNDQKTKTFWNRLELGSNFQTSRTNYNFPTVTDIGLSLGYRLGYHNVIGVGASYKIGWGSGFNHIALSSQGVGLRSFLNIHLKGSLSATGGFEYNYQTPFTSLQQITHLSYWTRSGLIGLSKTVSVNSRLLKKTSLQLLWDFLSYQQVPRTQPLLFRIGYTF